MKMITKLIFTMLLLAVASLGLSSASFAQQQSATTESISQAELEQILAPIALYPDTVLSHILIAATYPLEVVQAERWTSKNPDLQGSEAVEAVNDMDWDPSVRALVAFPQILQRLSEDLDWTQQLGDAFLQDEQQVLASVQTLRQLAYDTGSLAEMDKVTVTHDEGSIVIEPREREVVYVPYYDTRVVYGPWHWSHYPPVYWDYPYRHHYAGRRHGSFYWGPRIDISFGHHFSSFHWSNHHIVRIPYQHYRPRNHYNHRQIVKHDRAAPWSHNPRHRRGVAYRNTETNNRFQRDQRRNQRVVPNTQSRRGNLNPPAALSNKPDPRGALPGKRANTQFRAEPRDERIDAQPRPRHRNVVKTQQTRIVPTNPATNRTSVPRNPVAASRDNHRRVVNRQAPRAANTPARPPAATVKSQRPIQAQPQQRPAKANQQKYNKAESRNKQESKSGKSSAKPRSSRSKARRGERRQPR